MSVILNGWVNPRYLNYDWNRSFTITKDATKSVDIPVKIVFEKYAYDASKFSNEKLSYKEMEFEFKQMVAFLCVNELTDQYSDWKN